ncbi:MAG: hypothetical protein JJ863_24835 [Deltaproteobacteria bacterium]|nr:hypothetical protein [Deltaproteobacteria bacterium]
MDHWPTARVVDALCELDPEMGGQLAKAGQAFAKKRLRRERFAQDEWLSAQRRAVPKLYSDSPTPPRRSADPLRCARALLSSDEPVAVLQDLGERVRRSDWAPERVLAAWEANDPVFGITDHSVGGAVLNQHFRMETVLAGNFLSHTDSLHRFEVCGPVMATRGHLTDAHMDDPDIWNSCVSGAKVWFMTDSREWSREYQVSVRQIVEVEPLDAETFLSLPGSRWAVVTDGAALYCPNTYVHRVVTLERYVGFGTFCATRESAARLLRFWREHGSLFEADGSPGLIDGLDEAFREAA